MLRKKIIGVLIWSLFIVVGSYDAVHAMAGSVMPLACGGVAIVAFGVVIRIISGSDPNKASKIAEAMEDLQDD